MYLVYFDEVKYNGDNQPFEWLCGLAFPEEVCLDIDNKLSSISKSYFGSIALSKDTEFHAKDIIHGKGPYKGHKIEKRLDLYKELIKVIDDYREQIGKIKIKVNPKYIQFPKDLSDQAFMFFTEKLDGYLKSKDSLGLLIADSHPEKRTSKIDSLNHYRHYKTEYALRRTITNVIDTVHHTNSHHSRFLQLADVYVYTCALQEVPQDKYPQMEICRYVQEETNYYPDSCKDWPTKNSYWIPRDKAAKI